MDGGGEGGARAMAASRARSWYCFLHARSQVSSAFPIRFKFAAASVLRGKLGSLGSTAAVACETETRRQRACAVGASLCSSSISLSL